MRIDSSILTGVQFENCTFSNTLANYSDFAGCAFRGCTFKGKKNDFRQAFLERAVFEMFGLRRADESI